VTNSELLHVGTFGRPQGLKGHIKIIMHTSNFDSFKSLAPYFNENKDFVYEFDKLDLMNGKLVGQIKNCLSRNCVEKFYGKKIFIEKNKLSKTNDNQHYVFDLVGCTVKTSKNIILGKVISINNFGAGELMNVKNTEGKYFYLPINSENILSIDVKNKNIIANPLKGLID
tara:strand:- start:60 stop:569 length:510 start_codon:yes stop_codon:yes gene_type:complete